MITDLSLGLLEQRRAAHFAGALQAGPPLVRTINIHRIGAVGDARCWSAPTAYADSPAA
ncbi:hypothetical protein GPX89_38390 [Nocardia sp. ET3-3]|uniref:Uncharacterized protein n=1 Tax=Nocardia terrae TaxID=2675851 RepID=A0A7K1V943_9NOCA|nr:hypothetical protein [Nocardia terrae]MVU83096.1 hypothetical protein [Nocardia terrae]